MTFENLRVILPEMTFSFSGLIPIQGPREPERCGLLSLFLAKNPSTFFQPCQLVLLLSSCLNFNSTAVSNRHLDLDHQYCFTHFAKIP